MTMIIMRDRLHKIHWKKGHLLQPYSGEMDKYPVDPMIVNNA